MEHLYAIRGWVEGDSEIVDDVRKLVEASPLAHHWHFAIPKVGEHGFAFLGAVVNGNRRREFEEQLQRIASEVYSGFSDIHERPLGYCQVDCLSRLGPSVRWRIGGGAFAEESSDDSV